MKLKNCVSLLVPLSLSLAVLLPTGACGGDTKTDAVKAPAAANAATPAATTPAEVKVFVDTAELKPAPDFSLTDVAGITQTLSAYRGKVVIINFWATWCGPCKYEIPHFVRLYNTYKDKGLVILGIDLQEPKATVEPFTKMKGMTYPVLLDLQGTVPRPYGGVRGIPTSFVITQDGKIYRKHVGVPQDMGIFEEEVKTLLGIS